jgi:hypothetical protein
MLPHAWYMTEPKYIGSSNLLDPRHLELSTWLNLSILGLATCEPTLT